MSEDIEKTSNFKSAKICIMFLFYVLSFSKKGTLFKGDIIQWRLSFKKIRQFLSFFKIGLFDEKLDYFDEFSTIVQGSRV